MCDECVHVDVQFPTYSYVFVGAFLRTCRIINGGFRAKSHAWGEPHASPQPAAFEKKKWTGLIQLTQDDVYTLYQPSFR